MKRLELLSIGIFFLGLMFFGSGQALAAGPLPCDVTTGVAGNGECQITTLHNLGAGGVWTVDRTLHIIGPSGELRTNAASNLTLSIAGGATNGLIIETGGKITGNATGTAGVGATININVDNGNILLAASGATISAANTAGGGCGSGRGGVINMTASGISAKIITEDGTTISASGSTCSGGAINVSAPNQGSIDIDGDVLSDSSRSGTGNNQNTPKGGGPISIEAACDLTISDTGLVRSSGIDPGADLVHLKGGCDVLIAGKVLSYTTAGHGIPVTNYQHSNGCGGGLGQRPEKEFEALHANGTAHKGNTACVEIWAGNSLEIRGPSGGEVSAGDPRSPNRSWVDLFARGDIKITGPTPDGAFAVHANGATTTNTHGGTVTVKSRDGKIAMTDLAIQANGSSAGGDGGKVIVEAKSDINLNTDTATPPILGAEIEARGDYVPTVGLGGVISVQSFDGNLSWQNGSGDVRPNDTGSITLTTCLILTTTGTDFNGEVPLTATGDCGDEPIFESYVELPDCPCDGGGGPGPECEKASVKSVLNPLTGRFLGNLGPDVVVRLDLGQKVQDAVDTATDSNGDGYIIILVVKSDTGILGGHTHENVVISQAYPQRFGLIGCSVTVNAADAGLPAGNITSSASSPVGSLENIFIMDLHGADSGVAGWLVEGDGRYVRNTYGINNATGIQFLGNNNIMHNGKAEENTGVGIFVQGNGNTVDSADSFANGIGIQVIGNSNILDGLDVGDRGKGNTGDGISVAGDYNQILEADVFANGGSGIVVVGNSNQLIKNDVGDVGDKGNSGEGISVTGNSNKLSENKAYGSGGNGIVVTGNSNQLLKNVSGEKGKGNGGDGIKVSGAGNVLQENKASANGLDGFDISGGLSGGANSLKNNQSNTSSSGSTAENIGYEYSLLNYVKNNGGGNKADGTTVPSTGKCATTFPATNATANYTSGAACE